MLKRKGKNTEKNEREKYYQRNGYASEERLRVKGTWMKGTWNRKDRIEKQRGGRFFFNFFLNIKSARVLEK
jgi:hypothetical protein